MADSSKCSRCGAEMPNDAPGGHCLRCLLQLGLSAKEASAPEQPGTIENHACAASILVTPGDCIDRYKLLQQIGEGGYGVVYMAEQDEPVRRRVALKIIKLGMDTKQVIARFEAERQALALMDHPNIAKVFDAGATDAGRPYFVMELVRGLKITDYCDQQKLSTPQRLKLFIQVCQAIQHAHQKGVIHRDIKPSNILVSEHDGFPMPKVIDFGIAKATIGQHLTDKTLFTEFDQFIGTPAYTSPEQASKSGLDVDTRSDIYSLGVLLYELLTGHPPFEPAQLRRLARDEILRLIREKEPPRPSTRLTTLTQQELTTVAQRRQIDATKLPSLLRGDLDWIIMKCMEKDRDRRYITANGLAADLQCCLNDEPVFARPPGNVYRFQKMVRRNKLAFVAVSAVLAALFIGLGVSTWLFFQEKAARQRAVIAENAQNKLRQQAQAHEEKAKSEAAKSRQVAQFLKEMLNGVGPSVALGRDTTMLREILDRTAESVGRDLNEQPEVGADMRCTLGEVYFALGKYTIAEGMLREAIGARRKLPGNDNLELALSLDDLGVTLEIQAKAEEATSVQREALAIRRKLLGNEHRDVARSLTHLGNALLVGRHYNEAEITLREAVTMQRKLFGNAEDLDLAQSLGIFASALNKNGKFGEAEAMAREALPIRRKLLGGEHPEVAVSLQSLGNVFLAQCKLSEAEGTYRDAFELRRKLLGDEHPLVGQSLGSLVAVLKKEGKMADAVYLYRKAADQGRTFAQGRLGMMYFNGQGVAEDPVEAVKWLQRAADKGDAYAQGHLGRMYANGTGVAQDPVEAIKWYRKAVAQDDIFAEGRLGWMYLNGNGVAQDPVGASRWFRKAADQGDAYSQGRLGWIYANGLGVAQNPDEGVALLRKAADQGDILGQIDLGLIYQNGIGVAKDPVEAAKWYRKAASEGSADAQGRLGWMYANGQGVAKDIVESAKWYRKLADKFRKAAEHEDAQAWNTYARFLATCEIAELRDGAAAVSLAERAVAATTRKDPSNLGTLAAAYAETGQFAKAVSVQQEAIALVPDEEQKKVFASRFKLYESGLPCHEFDPN